MHLDSKSLCNDMGTIHPLFLSYTLANIDSCLCFCVTRWQDLNICQNALLTVPRRPKVLYSQGRTRSHAKRLSKGEKARQFKLEADLVASLGRFVCSDGFSEHQRVDVGAG